MQNTNHQQIPTILYGALSTDCASLPYNHSRLVACYLCGAQQLLSIDWAHAAISNDCVACVIATVIPIHPIIAMVCSNSNYTSASNPNHVTLFVYDCASVSIPRLQVGSATFAVHNNYPLAGAHAAGPMIVHFATRGSQQYAKWLFWPLTRVDYNGTNNPDHQTLNLSIIVLVMH